MAGVGVEEEGDGDQTRRANQGFLYALVGFVLPFRFHSLTLSFL